MANVVDAERARAQRATESGRGKAKAVFYVFFMNLSVCLAF